MTADFNITNLGTPCIKAQTIKWCGQLNGMEDIKLVKKITGWNSVGVRTKERPKDRRRDEVINDLKKLKLRNWIQTVRDIKAWNNLVQRAKQHVGL
jgi:hypothetical protein